MVLVSASALLASWAIARAEVEKGDAVQFKIVCAEQETVERHLASIIRTKAYAESVELLRADTANGACLSLPEVMSAPVEEVGKQSPEFRDVDGDLVQWTAVRVRGVWTLVAQVARRT